MAIIQQTRSYQCRICERISTIWAPYCPSCGRKGSYTCRTDYSKHLSEKIVDMNSANMVVTPRFSSGVPGYDRLTGGGIPHGSVTMLGGNEGAGKSTLTLEIAIRAQCSKILYVTGEEILSAIYERAARMSLAPEPGKTFLMYSTDSDELIAAIQHVRPSLLIVDSLQAFTSVRLRGVAGSPSQVRRLVLELVRVSKLIQVAMVLISQINQDGTISGPQKARHWVDAVAMLKRNEATGKRNGMMLKSRYAPSHIKIPFVMTHQGLKDEELAEGMTLEGQAPDTEQMPEAYREAVQKTSKASKRQASKTNSGRKVFPVRGGERSAPLRPLTRLLPPEEPEPKEEQELEPAEQELFDKLPKPTSLREAAERLAKLKQLKDERSESSVEKFIRLREREPGGSARSGRRPPELRREIPEEEPLPEDVEDIPLEGG